VNYGLLIFGELDRPRLAAALAEMLALTPDAVDIGSEDDDDRNWDAPVSCTVTSVAGEFHWHLDIYLGPTIAGPPPEPVAAAWLAARLRTVVAYESLPLPPSAYWLVGPDGRRTRARIYAQDADDDLPTVYSIDAVEQPVAALPGLPVAPIPEVIREYRMPTPLTDQLEASPDVTMWVSMWEGMVTRLAEGWPPDGWYPADYYREDLRARDELAAGSRPDDVVRALAQLDERFAALTEDDGGRTLGAAASAHWWWHRIPRPLPWRDTPGA
jgi:hypothetical protein